MLDKINDYSTDLSSDVRKLIGEAKAVATSLIPTGAEAIDLSNITKTVPATGARTNSCEASTSSTPSFSRLPEIPLPSFDGDFRYWPTFRDRFSALVDSRSDVSNIDKMHYLISCLKGAAADAVRSIPVSADNYSLVWSTLSARFYRPRLVATSLVDKLLQTSYMTQESHRELNEFVNSFTGNMSLLDALKIPDLGSFILFSIAFLLPVPTRKLFESTTTSEYPSVAQLLKFVQTRVSVLELAGEPRKRLGATTSTNVGQPAHQSRKVGERFVKAEGFRPLPTSLVPSDSNKGCPCCAEYHSLTACARFKSWSVDARARWTQDKRLCYICFSSSHWAPKCKSKNRCRECSRRHHVLLHPPATGAVEVADTPSHTPSPDTSVCAAALQPPQCESSAVLLGTALVHVRDRSGTWQTMRALVDSASQISAVTGDCVSRLGLKCETTVDHSD